MTYITQRLKELDRHPKLGLKSKDFDGLDTDPLSSLCLFLIVAGELGLGELDP